MIISTRCDVPMARSKRLLPCNKRCRSCVACILRDDSGSESHFWDPKGSDTVLLMRNISLRSYYGDYE